jgi:hypothetical protein
MDQSYWQRVVEEAEEELQAATKPSDVNTAARKLQRARAELRWLGRKPDERSKPESWGRRPERRPELVHI